MRPPRAVVITGIHSHGPPRHTILAECDTRRHTLFGESAVPIVPVELVRLCVVSHENVGPAVAVVIEHRHSKRLAGGIGDARLTAHILKSPTAQIVVEL